MYIEPSSIIKIYHNVPLDNTYNHTLIFGSVDEQNAYFHATQSIIKHTLSAQSYQRVVKGKMRVEVQSDKLYDCNYLAFQNTAFGAKWFYAFITNVEYINNVSSEISFEIDVMQTYLFDVELKKCFVEREHTEYDNIGDNIVAEPITIGDYVFTDYQTLDSDMSTMCVIIAIVDIENGSAGNLYDRVYSGAELWAFNCSTVADVEKINDKLKEYTQKPNAILSMYMCPKSFLRAVSEDGERLSFGAGVGKSIIQCSPITGDETFQGYKPRNKKLYTYPFNYFHLDNANGNSLPLRYEFFDYLQPIIEITGTVTEPVKCVARPCSYKGVDGYSELGGYTALNTESIALDGYPICSWNVDSWSQFVAQQSVPLALSTVSSIGSTVAGVANANIRAMNTNNSNTVMQQGAINAGTNLLSSVTSTLSTLYTASISADTCRGSFNNGCPNVANGKQQFYRARAHVSKNYAEIIDNYFDMFGYACNVIKVPNRVARPHWNYVKTNGCVVIGNAPCDDVRKICGIYDNGITFWKKADEVGDYSLDNSAIVM